VDEEMFGTTSEIKSNPDAADQDVEFASDLGLAPGKIPNGFRYFRTGQWVVRVGQAIDSEGDLLWVLYRDPGGKGLRVYND